MCVVKGEKKEQITMSADPLSSMELFSVTSLIHWFTDFILIVAVFSKKALKILFTNLASIK